MDKRPQEQGSAAMPTLRFGAFALDLKAGELRKDGRWIRLQDQPFQILRMLLESPGEVISREDIRKRLWPEGTVVEFDHSINAAVKRLRDALRDSAEKPRYIETLARRGYRFIGEVDVPEHGRPAEPAVVITSPEEVASPHGFPLRRGILAPLALAGVVIAIALGSTYYHRLTRIPQKPLQPLMRLYVDLGTEASPADERGPGIILSPDGTRLVYVSHSKLFVRQLDQAAATELPGTEGVQAPFFSPDGQWVGFYGSSHIRRVSLQSGRVADVCAAALGDGGSWGEQGYIIAATDVYLSRCPAAGGIPTPVTELAPGEIAHRWPQILPGGKAFLFSAYSSMTGLDGGTIEVQSLKDGHRKTLVRGGTWGRYLSDGYLVYLNNRGTLLAVPFDPDRLEVHGTATPVLEEVAYSTAWGSGQVDFSRAGTLVYRNSRTGRGLVTVQWLDGSGSTRPLIPVPGNYLSPALSPDGKRLALTSAGDIWIYEFGRGSMTRLTFGGGYGNPLWTPDGQYIVFRAARGIFWTRADGNGQAQRLLEGSDQRIPWSFRADGKRLAFVENNSHGKTLIWILEVGADRSGLRAGKAELFLEPPFAARCPMISPDGRWLAYMSNESGSYRVYVEAFPGGGRKRQVSGGGGTYPAWSRNGREIFFWQFGEHRPQGQLMVASYQAHGDSFVSNEPHPWSDKRLAVFSTTRSYDPAPDGKGVVALMPADIPLVRQDQVVFLLNFFDELRRRVPVNAR